MKGDTVMTFDGMELVTVKVGKMRTIFLYIRSLFCRHDWELIREVGLYNNARDNMPYAELMVYRCKKCGFVQKIKF